MSTVWYLPLEIVSSRYTQQLCGKWIPDGIKQYIKSEDTFKVIEGTSIDTEIKVGCVLDATGRGIYSLTQVAKFLEEIRNGNVKDNDIVYIQDMWTPGIEAIQYAIDLYKMKLKIYTMCHAQSVDTYDFTYTMKEWMRPIELGYDKMFKYGGIFVGSSIHKKQLRKAGFKAPIFIVSLPFCYNEVKERIKDFPKNNENAIVFSSRLDWEKKPLFMLSVVKKFLKKYPDWKIYVTTSGKEIRSNQEGVVKKLRDYANKNSRFILKEGITKDEYYRLLCSSKIQLNTSLQDYVSWTVIESTICECDICFPDFRSFPEFIPNDRLYKTWKVNSVLEILDKCITNPKNHDWIAKISDFGRLTECNIMCNDIKHEVNVWDSIPDFIDAN